MSDTKQGKDDLINSIRTLILRQLEQSKVYLGIVPEQEGELDFQGLAELGYAIMLNKPIVLMAFDGAVIPPGLRRVAHHIIERVDLDDPASSTRAQDALEVILNQIRDDE